MKILVNTSSALEGGSITHLRCLLPELLRTVESDEIWGVGDRGTRQKLGLDVSFPWIETEKLLGSTRKRIIWENNELPRLVARRGCTVVFHPSNFVIYRSPVPQVNLVHNIAPFLPEVVADESLRQRIRLRMLKALTIDSLRRSARTIFLSHWGKDLVCRYASMESYPGPVIGFGSDHFSGSPTSSILKQLNLTPARYILSVSHFYRYKKLEHLLDAYISLGRQVEGLPLVLVGNAFDSSYTDRLLKRARSSVGPVVFAGALPADDVMVLMKDCLAFVFSSIAENLPITLLEAMASGAPIITNRACSMPETCRDAALYVESRDADGYRRELERVLYSSSLREQLSQRALKRAQDFRWSRVAGKTLETLREVAAQ